MSDVNFTTPLLVRWENGEKKADVARVVTVSVPPCTCHNGYEFPGVDISVTNGSIDIRTADDRPLMAMGLDELIKFCTGKWE